MNSFINIFNMHGYDFYVYSAYSIVLGALTLHLFYALRSAKYIKAVISKR
jgi:heme exporter protein D